MKRITLAALCLGALLALPPPVSAAPKDNAAKAEIVIGLVAPLTGDMAAFGYPVRQAAEMIVAMWNDAGGSLGKRIRLAIRDDMGDAAEGEAACRELIEREGAVAIIGSVSSRVSLAMAPFCQEAGVPMISPTSTNPAAARRRRSRPRDRCW